ncbi:four helix bundle protein [Sediminibacterium soli]|uniref:four helix bundle protein n=1 Tax=Sediminibacterium soli TaxID=2698829 RepID=UPI00137AEE82|nr:four helix bundle protein [Sediminibacterium soli]NCI45514.1 four helix bundle protein [Sediminibacterium soli]
MHLTLAHTKLDVYQLSKQLLLTIYRVSRNSPPEERYNLVQQIRRAALSIHLNIAEDCSRSYPNDRRCFFEIARSSLIEVDTALDIAAELGYYEPLSNEKTGEYISRCFLMLTRMITQT